MSGKRCSLEILLFLLIPVDEEGSSEAFPMELPIMASIEKEFDQELVDFFPVEDETTAAGAIDVVIVVGDPFWVIIVTAVDKFVDWGIDKRNLREWLTETKIMMYY